MGQVILLRGRNVLNYIKQIGCWQKLLHMVWQMGKVGECVFPLSQKCFLLMASLSYGDSCASYSSHLLPSLLLRKDVPGMGLWGRRGTWPAYNCPKNCKTISTPISLNTIFIKVYKSAETKGLCVPFSHKSSPKVIIFWFLTVKISFSCFVFYK